MDTTLLLSLVGILISIYAIANISQKRNIKYKFSLVHILVFCILIVFFAVSLIFQGYFEIEKNNKEFEKFVLNHKLIFSMDYLLSLISFLMIIIISGYFIFIIFSSKIRIRNRFIDNLHVQYNSNSYDNVITDLSLFFNSLMDYYDVNEKKPEENTLQSSMMGEKGLKKVQIIKNKIINLANLRKYDYSRKLENFLDIILNDPVFIKELSTKDPSLANRIIESDLNTELKKNVLNILFKDLIKTKGSILHRQIKSNQNMSIASDAYTLYPKNYLIYSLFSDIEYAEKLYAWMPVGDGVIEYLTEQHRDKEDIENRKEGDYREKSWNSPIFAGIRYFDIMIREGLRQNAKWHMWLYYFTHFTSHIVKNIKYPDGQEGEFANMYEVYLYEIFLCYRDWIRWAKNDEKKYNVKLKDKSHNHENNNIIKSSIISLSQCMDDISESKNLREEFKNNLLSIVLNLYFELKLDKGDESKSYAEVMLNCIKYQIKGYSSFNFNLLETIKQTLERMDLIPIQFQQDGSEAVEEFKLEIEKLRRNNQ